MQALAVIPRHPGRRVLGQFLGVSLQLGEVVEGIGAVQFAGVDQTHEQIAHLGAVRGLIEQTVLSMKNAFLQGPLDDVRVQGRAGLVKEEGQPIPPLQTVRDRFAQSRVGLHFLFCELGLEPGMQSVHHGRAVLLMKAQSRLR